MANYNRITDEEISLVGSIWATSTLDEVRAALPHRATGTLYTIAKLAGVQVEYRQRQSRVENLLNGTPEAWYWLGFFLADGHISANGQLTIMLSEKDEEHLKRFAAFVESKVTRPYRKGGKTYQNRSFFGSDSDAAARSMVRVVTSCKKSTSKIREILGLPSTNKTANPPENLAALPDNAIECLFCGFFDGDGSACGRIECSLAWLPVLQIFEERGLLSAVGVSSKGFAKGYVPKQVRQRLRTQYPLPFLERKWALPERKTA